jgi:adenylate kinase
MRIVVLGPPGSGKGTRARVLEGIYGIPVVTTGDILRAAIKEGSDEGRVAEGYVSRGELVPDHIVNSLVEERLVEADVGEGFILDGYPRSLGQAEALDRILGKMGVELDLVLNVDVCDVTILNRLSKRRTCPGCGAIYNLDTNPPKCNDLCDVCFSRLIQRSDDEPEVIEKRLEVYREKTKPILERYEEKGLVKTISGDLPVHEIPEALERVLKD